MEKSISSSRLLSPPAWLLKLGQLSLRTWLLVVVGVACLLRLGLWLLYRPIAYGDTPSYWRLAEAIRDNWELYDGTRTPGYPLVLAAFGTVERIWVAQMGMGLLVTLLFFYMGWLLSGKAWFAGLAALAHTLNPGQILFEPNLLSETSTTFWVAVAAAGLFTWLYRPARRSLGLVLLIWAAVSMAWITRALFVFLPFWTLLFLLLPETAWEGLPPWRHLLRRPALARWSAYLLLSFAVVFGWMYFIHLRFGDWSLSTMTGYHMVQHTGAFFEYVPDEYADLRDTYLRYRDIQVTWRGNQTNTIWEAIPEMQEVSGASFYELSRVLARISAQLIREHPELYLQSVLKGWWYFWRGPVYWSPEVFHFSTIATVLKPLVLAGRLAVFGANMLFVLTSLLALLWKRARRAWQISPALWWLAGTVWATSIVQTLADHGDNPRFLIPLQSFVVLWVLWIIWKTMNKDGWLEPNR